MDFRSWFSPALSVTCPHMATSTHPQGSSRSLQNTVAARLRAWIDADGWGGLVCAITFLSAMWLYAGSTAAHRPGADGFYSWIYARSLAFDGDIHFANDYALCGDPFRVGVDRGMHRPDNMFYFGPAIVWTPFLLILRFFFRGYPAAATCGEPFSTLVLGLSPIMGAITAWLCYRLARRQFSDGVAALSVGLLVLGGPVLKFASVLPSYSHIHDALATCALLELTLQATETPGKTRRWVWVGLALCACILQRLSNVMFAVIPVIACLGLALPRKQLAISLGSIGAGALLGLEIQGAIYKYLYGSPFIFSHGPYFLHLAHAHPFLLLFDTEEGLFHFLPTVWLSVIGLYPAFRDVSARRLLIPLCVVALFELYLSSAALDWSASRRLTNLTPLWVLLACYPLRSLTEWLQKPSRALATAGLLFATPFVVWTTGHAWGSAHGKLPIGRPVSQAELQGGATTSFLAMIEPMTGSLPILPAEVAFALRYHLPRDRFGDAAYPIWYVRDFRTLEWKQRRMILADKRIHRLTDGFAIKGGGAQPLGPRARLVFAAQWPYATHIQVRGATAKEGLMMRVGLGRALGEPIWCGEAKPLPLVMNDIEFAIPEGAFSSGIQEIVFEWSGGDAADAILSILTIDDRTPWPAPFPPKQ